MGGLQEVKNGLINAIRNTCHQVLSPDTGMLIQALLGKII